MKPTPQDKPHITACKRDRGSITRKTPRWHLVYFVLAAFDLVTISATLYLNHSLMDIYSESIRVNEQWADRLASYSALAPMVTNVNMPGNEVFDTLDVKAELTERDSNLQAFNRSLAVAEDELVAAVKAGVVTQADAKPLFDQVVLVRVAMDSMTSVQDEIFEHFRNDEADQAGGKMATMDRENADLANAILAMGNSVQEIQRVYFAEQEWQAQRLRSYEYLIAGVIVLIIGAVTFYGHKIAHQVRESDQALQDALAEAQKFAIDLEAMRNVMDKHTLFSIADRAGKIVDVNEGFCKISGYCREELLGQDHRMLNSGHHPKAFWKDMWRTLQSRKPWRGEVCNRAKDGSLYWVDSTNIPQFDDQGKLVHYVSLRFDITKNKEAQRQHAQLVAALDASNDCFFMFDAKTLDFVYTNHGAKKQIGYTEAELATMNPVDIKPDFDDQSFAAAIAPLYEKPGTSMVFRTRHQHKDGHRIPVEIWLQLMEGLGDHGLFIAAVRDISAQLEAESEISEGKARLERATNGTSDGLWDYIPATGEVWYADQFKTLVGLEPHEYDQFEPILDSFADLLHPDDKDRTFAAINAHLEDDVPYDVEYRLQMRSGGYRWFRARGRATRDEQGIATRMAGSLSDVQATHDAFDLVEQANKAKSEFLAKMSHEIRTPMAAIIGFSDLLCGDLANDPTQAADAVRTIQSNANHLLTIINDILDVSKIEAEQMTVESIETRPTQIISEVLSMVRPRATGKGVGVGIKYETTIPETIQSDPTRLRQILLNLIGNAIKFTDGGSVMIHASCDPKSQQLKLSVADTGIGMSPEQCEVISRFQAFSQADASTTRKFGGSGLGLRISNALAQMLGGGIEVSSVWGQGSTFTATIATGNLDRVTMLKSEEAISNKSQDRTNDQEHAASKAAAVKPLNGLRILLAEDGPDNQRLISFILKKAGADMTVCENGLIAAQTLENADDQEQPNVVLMDMQMPVLDGYEATRRLRENGYTLPIIALTAHAMASDRQKCLDAGCDGYTTKPIDREKLIELVASYAKRGECGRRATPRNDPKPLTGPPAEARRAESTVLLSELADDTDMAELVDMYLAGLGPKAALVAELYAEHRLGELARLAHQLKGASGGYGFPTISEAAKKVELQATADPDLRQLTLAVDDLTRLCAQAIAGRPAVSPTEPAMEIEL